ncbi:signal transduction histidine kinase/DNA-binding response OmpR family regulator/ligand-binding sensor domain-containing protein [Granulicella aggregans]|uniref:histidine kinase n=1 Tax=Granulicella aggregans TaxID=474949 RepID=A0A7W7Z956_9BACT|nr:signal transduction histidine kinase/DNA-binding response OmpR family regulator/ligand-binding sensor domain-containing protein [Granulicella aggregans]
MRASAAAIEKKGTETGIPVIQPHSYKEYKDFGQVWTVAQDRRGVIYIGVSAGDILEYDGVSWRKIQTPMSVIRSLMLDSTGRVWVGGSGNFGYLEPDAVGSTHFVSILDHVPAKDRGFTDVWQALPTPQGVFFRSYELLFRWDGKNMHVWTPDAKAKFQALSEANGHIYTSQDGVGLQEIVGDELRSMPGGDFYKASRKLFLHPFDDGRMLVSARNGTLTLYDGQKVTPFQSQADEYLAKHPIYTSTMLKDGSLCITTLDGGAVIIGHDGTLRQIIDKADGLLDSGALSSFQDRDGAVWIGTGYGITRVEANSPLSIFSTFVLEDAVRFQGSIYVATASGADSVQKLVSDPRTNRPTFEKISGATQAFRLRVFKDPQGKTPDQLLVATSEGVLRVEGDKLVRTTPAAEAAREQSYTIRQSVKRPDRVFIGHGDGVGSMRWDGHQWIDEGRLPIVYEARVLAEDPSGVLWVGGTDGKLLRVEVPASGLREAKVEVISKAEGVPEGSVFPAFIDGALYASPGLIKDMLRWDPAAHKFVTDNRWVLPLDAPDASSTAYQDEDGSVWSVTSTFDNARIGRFFKQPDGTWRVDEDTYRPLTHFQINRPFVDGDGSIWATGEYLLRLNPQIKQPETQNFPPLVRQVMSGTKVVFGGSPVGTEEPRLPPATRALTFQFASLSFGNSTNTNYQYLLEGADKDWSAWGKQKEANYSGLGPGEYRFRVRSQADGGRVSPEGDFAFTILPPWYRTKIAYAAYAILFLLITYLAWRLISRYERQKARRKTEELESQARQLEATVDERTSEVRAQAAEIAAQKDSIELLSEIGKEITASLDLNTILFKLYERVNQIVDASIFGVGLYRPEKKLIEYSLAIENGKRYAPYTRSTEDKNQFPVWCIENRKPILLNDVATEYAKYIPAYEHNGLALEDGTEARPPASMIYLPLIAQERVLGVLSIQSFKKNAYTEQHLSLLQNLAAYTTIALDNANAYMVINEREHEVRERAAELVTINRITQALATQLDRDSLVQLVGDQVRDLFHAPIAYVALLNRATMMLNFPYAFGEEAQPRPFGTGLTSQIIRTGRPLLINEDMERNRSKLGIEQIGVMTASYLGVPIPSGGQMIGVISVQSTEQEGRFTEADQRLLSTIASAVGVAFHNASLFEDASHARAAAEQADAAKSSFLSTVSHELRTPLTSVLGFAKIIRRRLEERLFPLISNDDKKIAQTKTQVIENLGVVVSEGERLTKLIDDVLDLAKIEAGKFTWNMGTVSVAEVIDRAVAATASLFEAKKLMLVRTIEPDLPTVTGDSDRLIQVVINLISNAVKFTDEGSITCSAELKDGQIVVGVTDSGIGIAPADQPKVFEKFKQVGDTLTDKPKGTGLGLPICKEIVEYHGGSIWVESAPGQGSTFSFSLPIAAQTQLDLLPVRRSINIESLVKQLRERVETHQPHDKSILVVDDDPNIRSLLQQELTEAGYKVRLAEDGRKALALIREETPGLVILDVMMPEMNGFDVAAVLKNDPATMDIPIIILSIVEDKERGFRLGVDRYLTKPIDTASLFHEVDTLLDQGKSKKKVMVVDEDASTIRTLTDVLETRGYTVVESNGSELVSRAVLSKPDIIILNSVLSSDEAVRALRFEKGMENVLFLIYQ